MSVQDGTGTTRALRHLERLEAERDVKGLHKKARGGQRKNVTGIDSRYEPARDPEVRIDTATTIPDEAAELIIAGLTGEP